MMKIIAFICFFIGGCSSYYNADMLSNQHQLIDKDSLIRNNEAIIIGDRIVWSITKADDIDWAYNADPKIMKLFVLYGFLHDIAGVIVKPENYLHKDGLTYKINGGHGIGLDGSAYYIDTFPIINNKPALMYIDIKPGDIIYIGQLINNDNGKTDIKDNFDEDKEKIAKNIPLLANTMQKKLMKKALKPKECNFLIDDKPEGSFGPMTQSAKLDSRYPACIKALEELK